MNTLSCIAGGLGVLGAGYLKKDWGLSGIFGAVVVLVAVAMLIVGAAYLYAARAAKGENPCGVET